MKNMKFLLCFLFVSISIFLIVIYKIFFYSNVVYDNKPTQKDVVEINNEAVGDEVKNIKASMQKDDIEIYSDTVNNNMQINKKENEIKIINLKNKFEENNFVVKKVDNDFVQISKTNISSGEVPYNDCFLNLYYQNNSLNICDFVKKECADLECLKFDCDLYKNNWYKVAYYGDFLGSSDKQLLYKDSQNIIVANLECGDKVLENYDNKLFQDLINY